MITVSERTAASAATTCVVTVDTGPTGVRWALVAVSSGGGTPAAEVTRLRLRSATEVLDAVARFLADSGLPG